MATYDSDVIQQLYVEIKTKGAGQFLDYGDIFVPHSIRHHVATAIASVLREDWSSWYGTDAELILSRVYICYGDGFNEFRGFSVVREMPIHRALAFGETENLTAIDAIGKPVRASGPRMPAPGLDWWGTNEL